MEYLQKVNGWLKQIVGMTLSVLALAVVLQVLFGTNVAFFPVDVVGNVLSVTKTLGSEGLVGLVALWVLVSLFNRKQ
tara:strand:+ start:459 stop:689 length:231 start_codon:yes stop_codon:yes gene_type:complete